MANGDAGDYFNHTLNSAQRKVVEWLRRIESKRLGDGEAISIGRIEPRMKRYAENNPDYHIDLPSAHLYFTSNHVKHLHRDFKRNNNKAVSDEDLINFIKRRKGMDLYFDSLKGKHAFIYTDYKTKYIVEYQYDLKIRRKRVKKAFVITAGKANEHEFEDQVIFHKVE